MTNAWLLLLLRGLKRIINHSVAEILKTFMNYWLQRITGGDNAICFAHPLLFTHSILSIGWSDFSDDAFITNTKSKGQDFFEQTFIENGWGYPRNRWNLWRFIVDMKAGDIVIVPTWGEFSVFKIADDIVYSNESIDANYFVDWNGCRGELRDGYFYSGNNCVDLGFYRKVYPIALNIPREQYADQDLFSRMKIRQTNANISDLKESIEKAVNSFEKKCPINLKEQIVDETAPKLLDLIAKFTNDIKFEQLVQWYFNSIGANNIEVPNKNESPTENGDADVVAYFDNIKTAIIVQVKKHTGTTDEWAVQQIKGFEKNHNYGDYHTQMWVVSTCDQFSDVAIKEAETYGVRLVNGLDFCKMILDAGLEGLHL